MQSALSEPRYFDGPFEEHELNAGHWLMEEAPDQVVPTIVDHIGRVDSPSQPVAPEIEPDLEMVPTELEDRASAD